MTQIIENRTDVSGRILALSPHPTLPHYHLAEIQVEKTDAVAGFANLLGWHLGQPLQVSLSNTQAQEVKVGGNVTWRLRKAGPQAVFRADPAG